MSFLLDTNVISAVAPGRRERSEALAEWMDRHSNVLFLSVLTSMEIRDGIAKARREGARRKAADLQEWWDTVEHLYGSRILPFDLEAATIAGEINDRARGIGLQPGVADIAIAAIAQRNDLALLTRNIRHFAPLYSRVLNPFETLPS